MKVILLSLLVVCAIQTNASPADSTAYQPVPVIEERFNIKDHLDELISKLVNHAVDALQNVQNGINQVINQVIGALYDIEQHSVESINEIFDYIREQTKDLESVIECLEQQKDVILNVTLELKENIGECKQNATDQLELVQQSLGDYVVAIKEEINLIQDVVRVCLSEPPIHWIGCIRNNSAAIANSVNTIVNQAREAAAVAGPQIAAIKEEAKACVSEARDIAKAQLEVIGAEIHQCIQEKQESFFQFENNNFLAIN